MGLLALVRVGDEGIFGRDQIGENLLDPIEINSFWQASLKLMAIGADYAERLTDQRQYFCTHTEVKKGTFLAVPPGWHKD